MCDSNQLLNYLVRLVIELEGITSGEAYQRVSKALVVMDYAHFELLDDVRTTIANEAAADESA